MAMKMGDALEMLISCAEVNDSLMCRGGSKVLTCSR
jgi:hypothetical protein